MTQASKELGGLGVLGLCRGTPVSYEFPLLLYRPLQVAGPLATLHLHFFCICSYILHEHPNPITKRISAVPNCDWRGLSHTCRVVKPSYLNYLLKIFPLNRRGGAGLINRGVGNGGLCLREH